MQCYFEIVNKSYSNLSLDQLNTTVQSAMKATPYELVFGQLLDKMFFLEQRVSASGRGGGGLW